MIWVASALVAAPSGSATSLVALPLGATVHRIPSNVFQTTQYRLDCIPNHTEAFAHGLSTTIFSDEGARDFVADNYDVSILQHFDDLPAPHAYDFFRYLLLKKRGGIYLDIKVMPTRELRDVFALDVKPSKPTLITVLSAPAEQDLPPKIFNGVIAATPDHPLLDKLISKALHTTPSEVTENYDLFCEQFHDALASELGVNALTTPGHYESESTSLILLAEHCQWNTAVPDGSHECDDVSKPDRYNCCCNIRDEDGALQMHTRDPDYPYTGCETERIELARPPKVRVENPMAARTARAAVEGKQRRTHNGSSSTPAAHVRSDVRMPSKTGIHL